MRAIDRIQRNLRAISDPQVGTPKHDAIMLWLDANVEQVLQEYLCPDYKKKTWSRKYLDQVFASYRTQNSYGGAKPRYETLSELPAPPQYGTVKVKRKQWEVLVKRGQYPVGFVDMQVECLFAKELYISNFGPDPWSAEGRLVVNIEVKPTIPSVGELVRQLNLYREYLDGKYIVVSPDCRWIDILKSQKIGFIECPEPAVQGNQLTLLQDS